ncbi:MAG TPA: iron-sulfur cluster carrier protein ApbC [Anaerolineae bacterium]|nr:iron-sulfur cluster carrier protein ApbC [Anaerolineae bacterium]
MVTEQQVLSALSRVDEPELHRDLVSLKMIRDISIQNDNVNFTIILTTPACPLRGQIDAEATAAVKAIPGVKNVNIKWDANVPTDMRISGRLHIDVRSTIAVASGKGGVGKTTVAVNLAVALAQAGARVGLLDADIYGPNIPIMLGLEHQKPMAQNDKIIPLEAYGLKLMSMGFLVSPEQAMIWRGPMLHSAIRQFLSDVEWGSLDYMVIDLPPGTGDAQLTLAQTLPLTGAVIVATPQDVALADVVRGVSMFKRLEVPVLGVVENMSYFVCPHCGERTDIFDHGGAHRMADKMGVPFLGEIPLDPKIRLGGDTGLPVAITEPDSALGQAFKNLSEQVAAKVSVLNAQAAQGELIAAGAIPIISR